MKHFEKVDWLDSVNNSLLRFDWLDRIYSLSITSVVNIEMDLRTFCSRISSKHVESCIDFTVTTVL